MGRPVVHFEIGCKDKAKTAEFYGNLFGWTMQEMGPATMVATGADSGIQGHMSSLGHERTTIRFSTCRWTIWRSV